VLRGNDFGETTRSGICYTHNFLRRLPKQLPSTFIGFPFNAFSNSKQLASASKQIPDGAWRALAGVGEIDVPAAQD